MAQFEIDEASGLTIDEVKLRLIDVAHRIQDEKS